MGPAGPPAWQRGRAVRDPACRPGTGWSSRRETWSAGHRVCARHAKGRFRRIGSSTPEPSRWRYPPEVADRAVPGHWEGDLLLGNPTNAIGTLVERSSRYVMLFKLPAGINAESARQGLTQKIQTLPQSLRQSLTWDQGREMKQHLQFTIDTNVQVYFCDPHSPWQRALAENTNGLLRQYFPKNRSVAGHSQGDLDRVAEQLADRRQWAQSRPRGWAFRRPSDLSWSCQPSRRGLSLSPRYPPPRPPRSRPPRNPPPLRSRGSRTGGGSASAAATASMSICSSIGSPRADSSSIASCRLRLSRPWPSISIAFTMISSPRFTTSSTRSTRWSVRREMWTRPSWLGSTSTKAPNGIIRTTLPR